MTTKFEVEKFDRKISFAMWQVKMKAVLTQQDLHSVLDGKDNLPSSMEETKKVQMDQKALTAIQLCLSNEVLREVMDQKTAKDLWHKLQSLYITKTLSAKYVAKNRLYTLSMAEGTSISSHIDEFSSILLDLENMDIEYSDEDQALMLLRSLPPSFENFRETLIYSNNILKVEDVKAALISKELFNKISSSRGGTSGGSPNCLVSRGNSTYNNNRFKGYVCNYCKLKGHIKSQCPKLKAKLKNSPDGDVATATVAQDGEIEDSEVYVVNNDRSSYQHGWVLDSACSVHICLHRNWFSSFRPVNKGVVLLGGVHPCKVMGIGTVRVKTHNGTVVTLSDVRFVPDMSKNLISLPTLDKEGFWYSGGAGRLRVRRGARVIMKASLHRGSLYCLHGQTVVDSVIIADRKIDGSCDASKSINRRVSSVAGVALQISSDQVFPPAVLKEECLEDVTSKVVTVAAGASPSVAAGLVFGSLPFGMFCDFRTFGVSCKSVDRMDLIGSHVC